MTTWEYLTAPVLVHSTKQILDNFGADGWELVSTTPQTDVYGCTRKIVLWFKRPLS